MRQTTIFLILLGWGIFLSSAQAGVINANNGLTAGEVGWTVTPGGSIPILVTLARESGDSDQLGAAYIWLSATGSGSNLPTIAAASGGTALDLTGTGLLFAGGTPVGDTGASTSSVSSGVYMSSYVDFTSSSPYQLFRFDLTAPEDAAPGSQYMLNFGYRTQITDSGGDVINLTPVSGTIAVVPEPGTCVALASLAGGASLWYWRRRRRQLSGPAVAEPPPSPFAAPDYYAPIPSTTRRVLRRSSDST